MSTSIKRSELKQTLGDVIEIFDDNINGFEEISRNVSELEPKLRNQAIAKKIQNRLARTPIAEIRKIESGVRIQALIDARFTNMQQIDLQSRNIQNIPGIGPDSASKILRALQTIKYATSEDVNISANSSNWISEEFEYLRISQLAIVIDETRRDDRYHEITNLLRQLKSLQEKSGFFSWWKKSVREELIHEQIKLFGTLTEERLRALNDFLRNAVDQINLLLSNQESDRQKFRNQWQAASAQVLSRIDSKHSSATPVVQTPSYIGDEASVPAELAQQINQFEIDLSGFKLPPRRYQLFGMKFVLVAKKVILGDEMGLGKTIQALGVAQHLKNSNPRFHGIVIAPLAVLDNWRKETHKVTKIQPYVLHGKDKVVLAKKWLEKGGLAITNFESLENLHETINYRFNLVIIDEAHLVKNHKTNRSTYSRHHLAYAEHSLLMTGTPLENRGEEFVNLIDLVNSGVAQDLWSSFGDVNYAYRNAPKFRQMVGGIYLRRNRRNVLTELPDLVVSDEFVAFPKANSGDYESCIRAGNLMGARRALSVGSISTSPKMAKLAEIIESCRAEGSKVLVFSYFKEVLQNAASVVGNTTPIDGEVSHEGRQQAIEKFQKTSGFAALVMQIDVGGVGLNLQEASTVVIMEPQFTPGKESQAIGRAYRMGQTRNVMVHRLIVETGADQRINTALGAKERIAQLLAGTSELSDKTSEAVNEKSILNEERARLGLAS
jgi:SNF2 family DNA or RNA helicase